MTEIALAEEIGKRNESWVERFVHEPLVLGGKRGADRYRWICLLFCLETGSTYEHWSRFIVMTFCLSVVTILLITRCIEYVLGLVLGARTVWQQLRKP